MTDSLLALAPQLLTRAAAPPNGDEWLHEIKYDGYRLLATVDAGRVRLWSRPGADWTSRLPRIATAVATLGARQLVLDGELVYLDDDGFPDFERLQAATQSREHQPRLYYQVFDLLNINGKDIAARPLLERKTRLVELLRRGDHPRLRYVAHVQANAAEFFRAADELGLEGIVSKRARSVYRPGIRSADWVKVKCFHTQHFVIVGYTIANGRLESLAVAQPAEDGGAHYAGRVELGVPRRDDTLRRALELLGAPSISVRGASSNPSIRWVEPRLRAEVRALRWRPGRALRHAVLRGVSVG
jgi:bifunctional non-homologous end joining protein LigD